MTTYHLTHDEQYAVCENCGKVSLFDTHIESGPSHSCLICDGKILELFAWSIDETEKAIDQLFGVANGTD